MGTVNKMVWCKDCNKEVNNSYLERHNSSKEHRRNVDSARAKDLSLKRLQTQVKPITKFETETAPFIADEELSTTIGFGDYTNVKYEKVFEMQRKIIPASVIKTFQILLEKYWLYISVRKRTR